MVWVWPPHTSMNRYWRPGSHSCAIRAASPRAFAASRYSSTNRTRPPLRYSMLERRSASSSSVYACPTPARKSSVALASVSSSLDIANPTWISTQSPGCGGSSASSPMFTARRTPLTSTRARSGWLGSNSTTSPGMPRHTGAHLPTHPVPQRLQHQFVAAAEIHVAGAALRTSGQRVHRPRPPAAAPATQTRRGHHQVQRGTVGHGPGGRQLERLPERLLHHGVAHPDPQPDLGHRPPGRLPFDQLQQPLAESGLVHQLPPRPHSWVRLHPRHLQVPPDLRPLLH